MLKFNGQYTDNHKTKNQKQNGYGNNNGNKIRGLGSANIGSTKRQ